MGVILSHVPITIGDAWLTKLREAFAIAKEKKVDAIIDGGDLLDIPMVAYSVMDAILDLIEETGIPVYCLWGNHALIGHHIETSKTTSLYHMFKRCKLLKEAKDINEKTHRIKFVDYDHNIEERLKESGIFVTELGKKPLLSGTSQSFMLSLLRNRFFLRCFMWLLTTLKLTLIWCWSPTTILCGRSRWERQSM